MSKPALSDLPDPPEGKTDWPWCVKDQSPPKSLTNTGQWPKISIVTPSYNQGKYLEETIRSVLLQGYPDIEYIIIDGGSSDNSKEIITRYSPWLAYWTSEEDRGQSNAINKGLSRATGEIVAYLNSDDVYMPGTLEKISRYFLAHPDADVLYSDCRTIDDDSTELGIWNSQDFDIYNELCRNFIYQPTLFMRRQVFEKTGAFNEDLHYVMDIEYWYRASLEHRFSYLRDVLASFRISKETKSGGSRLPFVEERKRVLDRFFTQTGSLFRGIQRSRIYSWHHFHAGEQLFASGEFVEAKKEFAESIKKGRGFQLAFYSLAGFFDCLLKTGIFRKINSRFPLSP